MRRAWVGVLLSVLATLVGGCTLTFPEPIYANEVATYFPDVDGTVPDPVERAIPLRARTCAGRMNSHRNTAEAATYLQITFGGLAGLSGGVGGLIAGLPSTAPDDSIAAALTAAIGGGLGLVSTFVLSFFAPAALVEQYGRGIRSWRSAVHLLLTDGAPSEILAALEDCIQDLAPREALDPGAVPAAGPAF
jgi:hypothetical protein